MGRFTALRHPWDDRIGATTQMRIVLKDIPFDIVRQNAFQHPYPFTLGVGREQAPYDRGRRFSELAHDGDRSPTS